MDSISDPWYTINPDTGQPWVFQGEIGVEGPSLKCGWQHESRLFDGGPFNNNPEFHREMLICSKKFGGYK